MQRGPALLVALLLVAAVPLAAAAEAFWTGAGAGTVHYGYGWPNGECRTSVVATISQDGPAWDIRILQAAGLSPSANEMIGCIAHGWTFENVEGDPRYGWRSRTAQPCGGILDLQVGPLVTPVVGYNNRTAVSALSVDDVGCGSFVHLKGTMAFAEYPLDNPPDAV